ncbi:BMP family ABC transporter substrate-binding protein [Lachnoclostridium sp. Marseille-P6806]|uniref:BMP family ABC transporter substrate-binding protein n=1 Tax=Lachnoclostridium sp. Marseille-P6806 TaxID=2364793 RepID=UPI0013EF0D0A|nr:BMP family ABC transporter substrate-binding protein [Lachnoclostridium sp. Marseille-P6806]
MIDDYLKAKKQGDSAVRRAIIQGRDPYLFSLSSFLPDYDSLAKISLGIREIPLYMIAGTVTAGRTNSFAWNFMPLLNDHTEFALKWSNLYDSQLEFGIRDPIKVYEYMNRFYVQEGNKRVSVTAFNEGVSIAAEVIRVMPRRTGDKEVNIYYEYVDFFNVTGLFEITFSEEGSYDKLAEKYGQSLSAPWPERSVQQLRTDFHAFQEAFNAKGGAKLDTTAGDGFLKYIDVYTAESIDRDSPVQIAKNTSAIWNEILAFGEDSIVLIDKADPSKKSTGSLLNRFTGYFGSAYTKEDPLRIALIYEKNPADSAWTYGHALGLNEINEKYEGTVEAIAFENRSDSEAIDEAFDAAAADKDAVVFTTSPAMMENALRAAIRYPDMKILNCSINLSSSAVRTYYPRMYEVKYIMGALAAGIARDHRIGYLADYPIYGSIANINAFAIGAAMVDPAVQIHLKWSGVKNSRWEEEMSAEGISTISGPDLIKPADPSRKYGVYQLRENGSIANIAAPVWHWGRYYELIIDQILSGTWDSRESVKKSHALNYWYGLSSGVIDLFLSDALSYYSKKLVDQLRRSIAGWTLLPFDGEIRSQSGVVHNIGDPAISYEQIITMNWLNDNVIGSIPEEDELIDSARGTVGISGVKADRRGSLSR